MKQSKQNKGKGMKNIETTLSHIIVSWLVLLVIIFGYLFLEPVLTGFITTTELVNYTDNLSLNINENKERNWNTSNSDIKSIEINGTIQDQNSERDYIEDNITRYSISNHYKLNESNTNLITGLVVKDEAIPVRLSPPKRLFINVIAAMAIIGIVIAVVNPPKRETLNHVKVPRFRGKR